MPQTGEIDLVRLKASYALDDIHLVDKDKVDQANEDRLYFELTYAVGLTLLGNLISNFNWPFFWTVVVFIGAAIFFLIRYKMKSNRLDKVSLSANREHVA